MPQSYACLHHHIVFGTKHHRPWIGEDLQSRLYGYIGGVLRNLGSKLIAGGGVCDHVHLLVSLSRQVSVSDALRDIKSNSSSWVHETFPERRDFGWQDGYGAFAVSFSDLDRIKHYIAGQVEHHRRISFREEFITLLREQGVEFDEKYLFQ